MKMITSALSVIQLIQPDPVISRLQRYLRGLKSRRGEQATKPIGYICLGRISGTFHSFVERQQTAAACICSTRRWFLTRPLSPPPVCKNFIVQLMLGIAILKDSFFFLICSLRCCDGFIFELKSISCIAEWKLTRWSLPFWHCLGFLCVWGGFF